MFAILSANFTQLFVFAGYTANQKYIASALCENRDKPWLHCNGKCYLMKKIKQADDKERADERQTQKSLFQEVFFAGTSTIKFHSTLLQVIATPYINSAQPAQPGVIFQPPRA
ncbi:hypothetical protein [Mucilaginibacter gracilis]|nr:hypothetical protein [Mucilaginibacter gracilis]